jgi:hypothetical protein
MVAAKLVVTMHLPGVCSEVVVDDSHSNVPQLESQRAPHVPALAAAIARMVHTFRSVCVHSVVERTPDPAADSTIQRSTLIARSRSGS